MPAAQRRASIIEATIPLLEQQGVSISTRQVAEASGVAEGTLFRVFDSLTDILEAAVTEYLSVDRLQPLLSQTATGDSLESTTRATIQLVVDDYDAARRIFSTAQLHPHDAQSEDLWTTLKQRFVAVRDWLQEQFEPYADQLRLTPEQYTNFVITVAHGYSNRLLDPAAVDVDDLTQFALHGGIAEEAR